MGNQPPNQQEPIYTQQDIEDEYALRSYFMIQGQRINKCNTMLQSAIVIRGFKIFISVLLEIFMYLAFIAAILLIILLPSDLTIQQEINDNATLKLGYENNSIAGLMMSIKVAVFLISLPVLFCAVLLRRNRKKSSLIARAAEVTEEMKNDFDAAFQKFRF
jgi:hypothetical protein